MTLQALSLDLFGLRGSARTLCYAFALTQGVLNALTDHPLGIQRVVLLHGPIETPFVPALLVLPLLTRAIKRRNAPRYFVSFFAVALANYLMTDYHAHEHPDEAAPVDPASAAALCQGAWAEDVLGGAAMPALA